MPFKCKIKVATRRLVLESVVNDDNEHPGEEADAPANPIPVSVLQIFQEAGGNRCWYVHETRGWWGWRTAPCEQHPVLRIKTNERGRIRNVAYKAGPEDWRDLSPVNRPTAVTLQMELEIVDGSDDGLIRAVCRYVMSGGRPVKVCR